jgi:magnesium transporter
MSTTLLTHGRVTWTNIVNPTKDDVDQLAARYPQIHPLNLKDCLTELEFPKLDHHDDYVFLVVQFPFWDASEKISRPAEIDIFVAQGALVTSHRGELKPLVQLFENAQADEARRAELMEHGASPLLYHLLNALVDYCFPIVHKVNQHVKHIEEQMFHADTRRLLDDISMVRRDIIALRSILKPQLGVMDALVRGTWPFIHADLDPYWGDICDHLSQLCSLLDEYAEVVSGVSETIDTLASHRIDEVVRLLTIVTVLTLPITVISTIFSMNIWLPFHEHPLMFYSLMGIGICIAGSTIWYLRKRRWF